MKYNSGFSEKARIFLGCSQIFRALVIAIILSLLVVVIPATPALAAPEVAPLSPASGSVGTKVTVTGTKFESYIGDSLSIFFGGAEIKQIIPTSGSFTTHFNVPDNATPGRVYVTVKDDHGNQLGTRRPFSIVNTEILGYSPKSGTAGTTVTINGQGFYANGMVTFYYYDGLKINVGAKAATPIGELTYSFAIPDSTAGSHTIMVEDAWGNSVEISFKVTQLITITPTSGALGDEVTVSGTGFGNKSRITIYLDENEVAKGKTSECGSFEATFYVPVIKPGTYDIEVEDDEDNADMVEFTVTAGASLSQTTGNVGTTLIVNGTGFKINQTVTIKYDDTEVATATAGNNGAFSIAFTVPPSIGGNHIVTITDGTSTIKRTFTMEQTAPPTPTPLLPEEASEAEATAYFNWEDVTDPSGITYTFQITIDADFTSIVLEKEGLTYSDYTVTKGEELPPALKEAPYYWRVKAVDGASNQSGWSTPRSFYVVPPSGQFGWIKYVLIGLGVVLLGFLLFWLGRRTAYVE